jgi:PTH1 family peptidyl-tRNA hydrolase
LLLYAQVSIFDEKNLTQRAIHIVKPTTFMNLSGKAIPFLLKKGIKPEEILVIHDELEKPFGKCNIRWDGSARGHNGLRSIDSIIGKDYWRLRFGIGRPEDKSEVGDYVLSPFTTDQEDLLGGLIEDVIALISI